MHTIHDARVEQAKLTVPRNPINSEKRHLVL